MPDQSPESSPQPEEITIQPDGSVWEKGKGPGVLLDNDGNEIGNVDYRVKMPEHDAPKTPPNEN